MDLPVNYFNVSNFVQLSNEQKAREVHAKSKQDTVQQSVFKYQIPIHLQNAIHTHLSHKEMQVMQQSAQKDILNLKQAIIDYTKDFPEVGILSEMSFGQKQAEPAHPDVHCVGVNLTDQTLPAVEFLAKFENSQVKSDFEDFLKHTLEQLRKRTVRETPADQPHFVLHGDGIEIIQGKIKNQKEV